MMQIAQVVGGGARYGARHEPGFRLRQVNGVTLYMKSGRRSRI
jgi:hypothetical protein